MAKAKKPNAICEECQTPFYTKYPRNTKGCKTSCRMEIAKRERAERDKS